jgi:5-methylcytosine-specific restriction protein A
MPYASPRPCRRSGCPELVTGKSGFCEKHRKEDNRIYNAQRPESHKLYATPRWVRLRNAILDQNPFCNRCNGFADLVHHKRPHDGDVALFFDLDNLEPLCRRCHEREHKRGVSA